MTEQPAIIIFGAAIRGDGAPSPAMRDRVLAALRLGRTLRDPLYVPTGGVGRHGPAEALLMAELLGAEGVPAECIRPEPTGRNTIRSVRACRAMLRWHEGPVYAATSSYHLPRCVMLLRIAGLRARACPPPPAPARWRWWAREMAALPVDAAWGLCWKAAGLF